MTILLVALYFEINDIEKQVKFGTMFFTTQYIILWIDNAISKNNGIS